jgi:glycosyltransferase involved in cell wall biosynthesis
MATTRGSEGDQLVAEFGGERPTELCRYLRPHEPTVSVVVPTLNEARNLPYAFWRLPACVTEVIVVDGRSTDDTEEVAKALRTDVRIIRETQKGKGAALRRGFEESTGDIVVMFDADGSSDGAEIQRFVDVLLAGADLAKGSRFLPGGGSIDLSPIRTFGNLAICAAVNLLCQTRFTDLCYGYNAFWRDCLRYIDMDVAGFEVETRMNMLAARSGLVVVEVPSFEYSRVHGQSNLRPVRDGLRILRTIALSTRDILRRRPTAYVRSIGAPARPVETSAATR